MAVKKPAAQKSPWIEAVGHIFRALSKHEGALTTVSALTMSLAALGMGVDRISVSIVLAIALFFHHWRTISIRKLDIRDAKSQFDARLPQSRNKSRKTSPSESDIQDQGGDRNRERAL